MSRTLTHGLWQAIMRIFTRLSLSAVPLCHCQRLLPWSRHSRCEYILIPQLPQFKAHILAQAVTAENASAESSRDSQSPQLCPFNSEASLVLSSSLLRIFRGNDNRIYRLLDFTNKDCLSLNIKGREWIHLLLIKWNRERFRVKDLLIWHSDSFVVFSSPLPSSEIAPC